MKKKIGIALGTFCLCAVLAAGCAPTRPNASKSEEPKSDAVGERLTLADWGKLYPLEYDSFYSDYDLVKMDGKVHAHSNLVNKMALRHGPARPAIASCMYCKSADMTAIYEEYGDASFDMPYFKAEGGVEDVVETWNCNTCHSDATDPAASVGPRIVFWKALSAGLSENVEVDNAVCGQCHNALEPYRYLAGQNGKSIYDFGPYKNGWDADTWMQSLLENADYSKGVIVEDAICYLDEETKIVKMGAYNPDIEMFQNSTHQSLGVTCVDCHMTEEQNIKGETYTRHAASLSPLASETSLEYCLTCHKGQGIESTQAMVKWVREKQEAFIQPEGELLSKMETLHSLIADAVAQGSVDEDVLDKARWAYTTADVYYLWQQGGCATAGIKVAMYTSDAMSQYINRASALVDEAIDLLS